MTLQDLAWLLPRTIGAVQADGLDRLPTGELEIMRLLVRRPGLTLGQVAAELAIQPSNASATVRTLVARGLVLRARDPRDKRVYYLHPTQRADEIRRRRETLWGLELADRLEFLSEADVAQILQAGPALRELADNLIGFLE